MILTIIGAVIGFYVIAIWWFLYRMGDKLGRDQRWWVLALDVVLITPLLPLAVLLGWLANRRIK